MQLTLFDTLDYRNNVAQVVKSFFFAHWHHLCTSSAFRVIKCLNYCSATPPSRSAVASWEVLGTHAECTLYITIICKRCSCSYMDKSLLLVGEGNLWCRCNWIHFKRWSVYSFLLSSRWTKTLYPCDKSHAMFPSLGGLYTLRWDRLSTYSRDGSREKQPSSEGKRKCGNSRSNLATG